MAWWKARSCCTSSSIGVSSLTSSSPAANSSRVSSLIRSTAKIAADGSRIRRTSKISSTAAHVQHADHGQGRHRLAQGVAGEAAPLAEFLLRGQALPGAELAGDDHLLDRRDRYVGDCHAFILPSPVSLGACSPSTAPTSRARWASLL